MNGSRRRGTFGKHALGKTRDAGRALGELHVNFESVEPYMVTFRGGDRRLITEARADPVAFYRVTKMKFGGGTREKDKITAIYNERIAMENIPPEAYDCIVNGKPALERVMERQVVKTDKASGIVNDANDYATETRGDPRYPLVLFRRVIAVSLETMKIVNGLPQLDNQLRRDIRTWDAQGAAVPVARNRPGHHGAVVAHTEPRARGQQPGPALNPSGGSGAVAAVMKGHCNAP